LGIRDWSGFPFLFWFSLPIKGKYFRKKKKINFLFFFFWSPHRKRIPFASPGFPTNKGKKIFEIKRLFLVGDCLYIPCSSLTAFTPSLHSCKQLCLFKFTAFTPFVQAALPFQVHRLQHHPMVLKKCRCRTLMGTTAASPVFGALFASSAAVDDDGSNTGEKTPTPIRVLEDQQNSPTPTVHKKCRRRIFMGTPLVLFPRFASSTAVDDDGSNTGKKTPSPKRVTEQQNSPTTPPTPMVHKKCRCRILMGTTASAVSPICGPLFA
jgi:hypothetical protein